MLTPTAFYKAVFVLKHGRQFNSNFDPFVSACVATRDYMPSKLVHVLYKVNLMSH